MTEDPLAARPPEAPIALRAHNALCLLGFRGRGYSPAFVERTADVARRLRDDPSRPVRLLARPDVLCDACPNLATGGCALGATPEARAAASREAPHEAHMRRQDEGVLARLSLSADEVVPWETVLRRVGERLRGRDLPSLCTTCPWLPLGWCAEGVDALAAEVASVAAGPRTHA